MKSVYSESKTETEQKYINGVYIMRRDKDLRRIKKVAQNKLSVKTLP